MTDQAGFPARHVYDMGVVGNCSFLAYVDRTSAVRWMCLPRFDSSFAFGSLLAGGRGGRFTVEPVRGPATGEQSYLKNSNVLVTEFQCEDGSYRVTDFAPRFRQFDRNFRPLMLVRRLEPRSGSPSLRVACRPVGAYGATDAEAVAGSNHIRYLGLGAHVRLTTDVPIAHVLDERPFVLSKTRYLVFTWGEPLEAPLQETCEHFLDETLRYWRRWVKSTALPPFHQEALIRSALALKLHQYEDTGGVIASGTTSLPEAPASERTWDYRYCWLRDAFFTLNAFASLGHFEEMERMFDFVRDLVLTERDSLRPLYTVTGGNPPDEAELDLPGYLGHSPVRVGNAARDQVQNDVYGQALACLVPLFVDERLRLGRGEPDLTLVRWLLDGIRRTLLEPDAGIWEYRGRTQVHAYTLLSHWTGCSAAAAIAHAHGDGAMLREALEMRGRAAGLLRSCRDPRTGMYGQAMGVAEADASSFLLVTMGFLDPRSDEAAVHVATLARALDAGGGLLYRYRHADDFGQPETMFLVCSFWHAEALACVGRLEEAAALFGKLLGYANPLGLFSEDADQSGGQWGNYPQTYTHAGLLNAAFRIAARLDRSGWLASAGAAGGWP